MICFDVVADGKLLREALERKAATACDKQCAHAKLEHAQAQLALLLVKLHYTLHLIITSHYSDTQHVICAVSDGALLETSVLNPRDTHVG